MAQSNEISLAFVGDVMLGRLVNKYLKQEPPEYVWGDTIPILKRADLRLCNLECVISDRGEPWSMTPKVFHFRTDARNVAALEAADINMVSVANNHVLDYGYDALEDTLNLLEQNQIAHAGAGPNLDVASTPAFKRVAGRSIAMLALTDNEVDWHAKLEAPGTLFVPIDTSDRRAIALFTTINQLKARHDIVIVSVHWGGNWGYEVPKEHVRFAHRLVLAGADVIFGHSPHVCRAVEIYGERPIFYSCGDFIDDYAVDEVEPNDESFIFLLTFGGNLPLRIQLYPTIIENFQARLAGNRSRAIAARMQQLIEQFDTVASWDMSDACLQLHP